MLLSYELSIKRRIKIKTKEKLYAKPIRRTTVPSSGDVARKQNLADAVSARNSNDTHTNLIKKAVQPHVTSKYRKQVNASVYVVDDAHNTVNEVKNQSLVRLRLCRRHVSKGVRGLRYTARKKGFSLVHEKAHRNSDE